MFLRFPPENRLRFLLKLQVLKVAILIQNAKLCKQSLFKPNVFGSLIFLFTSKKEKFKKLNMNRLVTISVNYQMMSSTDYAL